MAAGLQVRRGDLGLRRLFGFHLEGEMMDGGQPAASCQAEALVTSEGISLSRPTRTNLDSGSNFLLEEQCRNL